jgi:hypothetical protein
MFLLVNTAHTDEQGILFRPRSPSEAYLMRSEALRSATAVSFSCVEDAPLASLRMRSGRVIFRRALKHVGAQGIPKSLLDA